MYGVRVKLRSSGHRRYSVERRGRLDRFVVSGLAPGGLREPRVSRYVCVLLLLFFSPSEVFFPERRRKIVACTRGFPVSFPPETRSGRAKIVLVFLFARREFVREVRRARAVKKDARALSVKGIGRGRFFFFFSQILEKQHGQKTDLVFFSARRARNQQKPIYSNRTSFKRSTSRSTYTARHLHRFRLDYRQRRNARDNPRGRLDRRENKFG